MSLLQNFQVFRYTMALISELGIGKAKIGQLKEKVVSSGRLRAPVTSANIRSRGVS